MSLNKLPDEILIEVLKEIKDIGDQAQVSLTSKRLHEAIEPILYSSFHQHNREATAALIRTILAKPHLARYVKIFTAHHTNYIPEFSVTELRPVGEVLPLKEVEEKIRQMVRAMPVITIRADNWVGDFNRSLWDACTAFLLLLLPNIEKLELVLPESFLSRCGSDGQPNYLPTAFSAGFTAGNSIAWQTTLQSIRFESLPGTRGPLMSSLAAVPDFEFLEVVTIVGIEDDDSACYKNGAPLISKLSGLFLLEANIESEKLEEFLKHCSQLKTLWYFQTGADDEGDGMLTNVKTFSPATVGRGIKHLHGCLEDLAVFCADYWLNMEPFEPLGSLAEFQVLRALDTTECILLGRDRTNPSYYGWDQLRQHYTPEEIRESILNLPTSIEELVVRRCRIDIFDWLEYLLEGLEVGELHLKYLKVIRFFFDGGSPPLPNDSRGLRIDWHEWARLLGIDFRSG